MEGRPISSGDSDRKTLLSRLEEAKRLVAPKVPQISEEDLDLILMSLLRPFGSGKRFFLREIRPGVHVF